MKQNDHYQGKFYTASRDKRKRWLRLAAILGAAVVILILLAVAGILLHNHNAERDLEALAAQVTTAIQTTAPTVEETQPETTAPTTMPTEQTQPPEILPQYAELADQNPEMVGWIRIADTTLDYPVMHTPEDPQKYLHLSFEEEYSYPGLPFIDANCTMDSDNLLIYGHNMPNGTMFRSLMKYQEKNYWQAHPTIRFDTLYEEQEYEVLAAFYDRVYYKTEDVFKFYQFIDAEDEQDFDNAIAQFQSKALYDTGVTATYGDKLITLVTCAYHTDNGRFVVVAKRK